MINIPMEQLTFYVMIAVLVICLVSIILLIIMLCKVKRKYYMNNQSNDAVPHKRRVRYKGTHPKKFHEKYKEANPVGFPSLKGYDAVQRNRLLI